MSSIVFEHLKFVTRDNLLDSGWWSDVFRNPTRDIPMFCIRCGQQRMHRKAKVSPIFEEIFDGDRWCIIVVGLYFECAFCLEEAYYNE